MLSSAKSGAPAQTSKIVLQLPKLLLHPRNQKANVHDIMKNDPFRSHSIQRGVKCRLEFFHDDLSDNHFNTESLREFSKESYDKKFVEAKTILATVMRAHMWIHNFSLFVCQDCQ